MRKPVVWIIKEQMRRDAQANSVPMDYSPAHKFGELRFITEFDLPTVRGSTIAQQWYKRVVEFVREYNSTMDSIILTGSPLAMFMIGCIFSAANKAPRILVWRREVGEYVPYDPVFDTNLLGEVV